MVFNMALGNCRHVFRPNFGPHQPHLQLPSAMLKTIFMTQLAAGFAAKGLLISYDE